MSKVKTMIRQVIDKSMIITASGGITSYMISNIMPWLSFSIAVCTLIYGVLKIVYLIKNHGITAQTIIQHDEGDTK